MSTAIDELDTVTVEPVASNLGTIGKFVMLDKMSIAHGEAEYQRRIRNASVAWIAANFKWEYFGVLIVGQRANGKLYCIEGQHRLEAALMRDDVFTVPCIVIDNTTVQREAQIFAVVNGKRDNLTSYELFVGKLLAKDPEAVAMNRIFERNGVVLGRAGSASSIAPGRWSFRLFRTGRLEGTLKFIAEVWPEDEFKNSSAVVLGTSDFIFKAQPEHHIDDIVKCFKKISLTALYQKSTAYNLSLNRHQSVTQTMKDYWNKTHRKADHIA